MHPERSNVSLNRKLSYLMMTIFTLLFHIFHIWNIFFVKYLPNICKLGYLIAKYDAFTVLLLVKHLWILWDQILRFHILGFDDVEALMLVSERSERSARSKFIGISIWISILKYKLHFSTLFGWVVSECIHAEHWKAALQNGAQLN